jgi:hypothetical protein
MTVWPARVDRTLPPIKKLPSLTVLRRWERALSACHTRACAVSDWADELLGAESEAAILISDPIIELHVALGIVESMIEERLKGGAA